MFVIRYPLHSKYWYLLQIYKSNLSPVVITGDIRKARTFRVGEINIYLDEVRSLQIDTPWEAVELERAIEEDRQSRKHVTHLWESGNRILLP
jgi:hypothetical protein